MKLLAIPNILLLATFLDHQQQHVDATLASNGEIGIAMAGGNMRAASSIAGVLRGFQQKVVTSPTGEEVPAMDLVKYNSGISGGALPSLLYTYAQVSTEELLETNRTIDPAMITSEMLQHMPTTSMGYIFARKPKALLIIVLSILKTLMNPLNLFKPHSLWSAGNYKKVYEPLNVPKNKYFTSGQEELDQILQENPKLKKIDFLLPREGVKTMPMILFSMVGERVDRAEYMKNYFKIMDEVWTKYAEQVYQEYILNSFDNRPSMTDVVLSILDDYDGNMVMPYVVTPDVVENKYSGTALVNKNKVEFPEKPTKPFQWGEGGRFGKRKRFSVEFLSSMSTNFPGLYGADLVWTGIFTGLRNIKLSDGSTSTRKFVDGGRNDLLGIVPLVARGVENIICVYNFNQNQPHASLLGTYADIYKFANATSIEDPDFDSHFKEWLKRINPRFSSYFGFFSSPTNNGDATVLNHVFHDPNLDHLKNLMVKFNSLFKAGEPLIATMKDLEVIDNPFWGIKSGKKTNLTLMYFNMPKKFSEKVSIEVVPPPEAPEGQTQLDKIDSDGRFNNLLMRTIPELDPDSVKQLTLSNEQVNMVGYLGSWMVHHSWNGLRGHNGELMFEGFRKIFEKN